MVGRAIWSILREVASRGPSALADILVIQYSQKYIFKTFAFYTFPSLAISTPEISASPKKPKTDSSFLPAAATKKKVDSTKPCARDHKGPGTARCRTAPDLV